MSQPDTTTWVPPRVPSLGEVPVPKVFSQQDSPESEEISSDNSDTMHIVYHNPAFVENAGGSSAERVLSLEGNVIEI